MLSARYRFSRIFEWIYGDFRKRFKKSLVVELRDSGGARTANYDLELLSSPVLLGDTCEVEMSKGRLYFSVPTKSRVQLAGLFGWVTVWDGNHVTCPDHTIKFIVDSLDRPVRIETPKHLWTLGVLEEKPGIISVLGASLSDWRLIASWVKNFFQSGITHAAIIAMVIYGSQMNWGWLSNLFPTKTEVTEQEIPVEQIPVASLSGEEGTSDDYAGRDLLLPNSQEAKARVEKQVEKVTDRIQDIVSQMKKMALQPKARVEKNNGTWAAAAGSLVDSMRGSLSAVHKTDMQGGISTLSQLNISQTNKLTIANIKNHEFSQKDQEEVADIFRSLQDTFRGCYESALLKNEELAVTVKVESQVAGSGYLSPPEFAVTGRSTPEGESVLTGCLADIIRKIKVSRSLSGAKIRNQFIFKS